MINTILDNAKMVKYTRENKNFSESIKKQFKEKGHADIFIMTDTTSYIVKVSAFKYNYKTSRSWYFKLCQDYSIHGSHMIQNIPVFEKV